MELSEALNQRNFARVKRLLKNCDINEYFENGETALHQISNFDLSKKEERDIFELIIKHPLIDINLAKFNGKTILHLTESAEMVEELLKLDTVDLNIRDNKGNTPLMEHLLKLQFLNTSYYNNIYICSLLIKSGADVNFINYEGDSPILVLYKLYITNDIEDLFCCIINHPQVNVNAKNRHGDSLLHLAESALLVKLLLNNENININALGKKGNTPLLRNLYKISNLYKQQEPNIEIMDITRLLIEEGADVNLCNNKGNAPIHMVHNLDISKSVNRDFFNYLTKHPLIDVNVLNVYGSSFLDLAEEKMIKAAVHLPFEPIILVPALKINDKNIVEKVFEKWDKANYTQFIDELIEYFRNDEKYGFFSLAVWKFIYRHKDKTSEETFKMYFNNVILYFIYYSLHKYPITLPEFELFMDLFVKYTGNKFQIRAIQTTFLKFRDSRLLRKVIKNAAPADLNKIEMQDDPFLYLITHPQHDIEQALQILKPTTAEDYFFNIQHIARYCTLPVYLFEDYLEEGFDYGSINNAIDEIELTVFKPKSLIELSRNVARWYISRTKGFVNAQELDRYLDQIEIPGVIKQILMLERAIHPQIALPVLISTDFFI